MGVRSLDKGLAAKRTIIESFHSTKSQIDVWALEMESIPSVQSFASRCQDLDRLDALLLNAGMTTMTWRQVGGVETTLLTNVLSPILLSLLLIPVLRHTTQALDTKPCISMVVSESHFVAEFREKAEPDVLRALNTSSIANMSDR